MLGVVYGFSGELAILALIGLGYNLAVSFVVFWLMQLVSRLRIVMVE